MEFLVPLIQLCKRKLLQKKELICKVKEIYSLVIKKTNVFSVMWQMYNIVNLSTHQHSCHTYCNAMLWVV